jgi:hypothetical protein
VAGRPEDWEKIIWPFFEKQPKLLPNIAQISVSMLDLKAHNIYTKPLFKP